MESLKEGCRYEFVSSSAVHANVSVVHVKLTDTSLKAIEEFSEWFRKSKGRHAVHSRIQFKGNQGVIEVPIKQTSEYRTFGFSLSATDDQKDGSLECIRHSVIDSNRSVSSVGIMSYNLRVQATEDVYQTTREKMSIAEEESKKVRTQTIEQSGPNIGRKVKKFPSSKTQTTTPRNQVKTVDMAKHINTTPCTAKNLKSDVNQHAMVDPYSLRDRVVHLLALRAYKQPELILRLQRDGCRPDVSSLRAILDEVAVCSRDSFTLHRHLCATDVRSDWPLYTDEDRAALSRKLKKLDELPLTHSPALSPCPSTGSRGSPRQSASSQKRVSSTTDDGSSALNSKRPRVAHLIKKPANPCANETSVKKQKLSQNATVHGVDSSIEGKLTDTVDDDFVATYKPIRSTAERRQYKRDFSKEYAEYLDLHKKTEQRMLVFNELSKALKQHPDGSPEYETVKQQIYDEYMKLKMDSCYSTERQRCDYLHRKLGHIKRLVNEYDNHTQLSVDSSSSVS